jgi:hypothetical protein
LAWDGRAPASCAAQAGSEQPQFERSFNPTHAAIVVCDEDPTQSLVERSQLQREALGAITERSLGELILTGLDAPAGLLSHLREKRITSEQVRAAADRLREDERKRGQIASPSARDEALAKAATSAAPLVRLSRVLDRLADELASERAGPAYSLVPEGAHLLAQGRRRWPFHKRRLLVHDGTANPEILKQFVPTLVSGPEIRVERNARIIQVTNATFYKGSLIRRPTTTSGNGEAEPTERLLEVGDFIEGTAGEGRTLVVANKPVRCALTGEDEHGSLPISTQYRGPMSRISATSGVPMSSRATTR